MKPFVVYLYYLWLCWPKNSPCSANKFDKLRNTLYFVDKTELLDDFFSSEHSHYITCPPKFGKSTILDMIDLFAQVEIDSDYKAKDLAEETYAHQVFEHSLISNYPQTVGTHLARHPVIHVKLSDFPYDQLNVDTMLLFVNERLRDTVRRYEWVFNLPEEKLNYRYDKYADDLGLDSIEFLKKVLKRKLNVNDVHTSLEKLSQILYRLFYQEVIILVDDYDHAFTKTILNSVSEHNNTAADMMSAYNMLNVMLAHSIKHLRFTRALLSGVCNLPFEMVNPPVSDYIRSCRFLDDHYFTPYFGFTATDMTAIYYRSNCSAQERQNVEDYYAAYKSQLKAISIYDPNSIVQYFTRRPGSAAKLTHTLNSSIQPTAISSLILRYLNVSLFRHEIIQLVNGIATKYRVDGFSRMHLSRYVRLMNLDKFNDDSNTNTNVLLTFCYDQGYLSYDSSDQYVLPNLQIRNLLCATLRHYYRVEKRLALNKIGEYFYKMLAVSVAPGDGSKSSKLVKSYIRRLTTLLQTIYQHLFAFDYDPPTVLENYYVIYTGLRLYNSTKHPLNNLTMPMVVSRDYMSYIPSHIRYEISLANGTLRTRSTAVVRVACERGEQIEPQIKTVFTPHDDDPAFAVFKIFINRRRNVTLEMNAMT